MRTKQATIRTETELAGIGLHSGERTSVRFKPAPVNSGIVFYRADLPGSPPIRAILDNVTDLVRGTTIGVKDAVVMTIEHLLSAIAGLEIDNIECHVTGPEVPVGDGSAMPFVEKLLEAEIEEQDADRNFLVVNEIVTYADRARGIDVHVLPFDGLRMTFMVDYQNAALGTQYTTLDSLEDEYVKEFAAMRTFCFLSEVVSLYAQGLAKGGSLENAMVIVDRDLDSPEALQVKAAMGLSDKEYHAASGILGDAQFRSYNEPVRHKLLDLLGDLTLLGMPIKAHIIAARSGHQANIEVARLLKKFADRKAMTQKYQAKKPTSDALLDIHAVLKMLPHRYPFLFIDRVLEMDPKERIVALKNVTINEPFFQGHFGDHPVMPGVLLLEVMAQAGGLLMLHHVGDPEKRVPLFTGLDAVKFRRPVSPGDTLRIEVALKNHKMGVFALRGEIFVDGKLVTEANFTATTVDK